MTYTIPYILKELPTLKEKKRKERTYYTQKEKKYVDFVCTVAYTK